MWKILYVYMEQINTNNGCMTTQVQTTSDKAIVPQEVRVRGKRYDIFVSYRSDWGGSEECKSLGCAVARSLVQPLKRAGYSVYFDCDEYTEKNLISRPQSDRTVAIMRRCKLIIILLSDCFFDRVDGSGFASELNAAKTLLDEGNGKQKVIALNINKSFHSKVLYGTDFEWINSVKRRKLHIDEGFNTSYKSLLKAIRNPSLLGPRMTILQTLVFLLFLSLGYIGQTHFDSCNLLFAGGGTARNFLQQKYGISVGNYKRGSVYLHMPSESAAVLLAEAVKDSMVTRKTPMPIILSAERYTDTVLKEYLEPTTFKSRIFQLKCGDAKAQVLIYPKDPRLGDSISLETLADLIKDSCTFVATTNYRSGTYCLFRSVLDSILDGFDAVIQNKRDRGLWDEFSPGIKGNYLGEKINDTITRVLVLQNEYYDILKVANLNDEDHNEAQCVTLYAGQGPVLLPVYVYTVIGKYLENGNPYYKIDPKSEQGKFLKKLGYTFPGMRSNDKFEKIDEGKSLIIAREL